MSYLGHDAYLAPAMYAMHPAMMGSQSLEGRSLYIGNLDPKVTEGLMWEIFSTIGAVETCKLIKDKVGESSGYGFVDFFTREDAEKGLQLNGRLIYNKEIKVNWAAHATNKEDTSNHFNIFVGDLSSEINDETLRKAFAAFGSISEARVMWDQNTGRSRGYGFVAFRDRADAERAMTDMNGVWLGNRAIRCNWANQKNNTTSSSTASSSNVSSSAQTYEEIASQSPVTTTTVYVGNLAPEATEESLRQIFHSYGTIEEVRIQKDKSFGFVRYQTHDQATRAIISASGTVLCNRTIKCSWGKEKSSQTPQVAQQYGYYYNQPPYNMYNMQPYYQYYQADPSQYYAGGYDPYGMLPIFPLLLFH